MTFTAIHHQMLIRSFLENSVIQKQSYPNLSQACEVESLYMDAHRDDNELFDIISEFACVHDDIYFEAGMLVGFQLYKELTEKYEHHADKDISAILEKRKQPLDTDHEASSTLESFCKHRLNTAFE